MSGARIDLVIDRLVVDGLDLAPSEADDLSRLLEQELRRIVDAGVRPEARSIALVEAKPLSLGDRPDARTLARALAERIASETCVGGLTPGGGHGSA